MNPQQKPSESKSNFVEAEIQHNIPVKFHADEHQKNPIASVKHILDHDKKKDKDLDQVLDDVNKSVKEADKKSSKRLFPLFRQKHVSNNLPEQQKSLQTAKSGSSKPIGVVAAAAVVACGLIFAAFYAFNHTTAPAKEKLSNKPASTSSTLPPASASSEVKVADLTKLSSDLTAQINALSDAQDFNPTDLSDKNLGL
jgi:CRISPR/Cas system-associated endonuclease/helicase Cas3